MRKIILGILICLLLSKAVQAVDVQKEQEEAFGLETLEEGISPETRELLGDASPTEPADFSSSIQDIFLGSLWKSQSVLRQGLTTGVLIVMVAILTTMTKTIDQNKAFPVSTLVGLLAITSLCSTGFANMIDQCAQTLEEMLSLNTLLLPVMAAASAASGNITTSAAIYGGTVVFSNVLMNCILKLLIPLVYVYIAISLVNAVLSLDTMGRMCNFIQWIITVGLKGSLYVFTGYLALTGIIGGAGDAAAIKAAKLAMSGMVPVVGSILSDASETVLASAMFIRSCAGTFGLLAVLAVCLTPFLKIGFFYLCLKVTAAVGVAVGTPPIIQHIDALSKAMGFLLAMTGVYSLMTLISCVCSMQVSVL